MHPDQVLDHHQAHPDQVLDHQTHQHHLRQHQAHQGQDTTETSAAVSVTSSFIQLGVTVFIANYFL